VPGRLPPMPNCVPHLCRSLAASASSSRGCSPGLCSPGLRPSRSRTLRYSSRSRMQRAPVRPKPLWCLRIALWPQDARTGCSSRCPQWRRRTLCTPGSTLPIAAHSRRGASHHLCFRTVGAACMRASQRAFWTPRRTHNLVRGNLPTRRQAHSAPRGSRAAARR
jgi:hypothetical protein